MEQRQKRRLPYQHARFCPKSWTQRGLTSIQPSQRTERGRSTRRKTPTRACEKWFIARVTAHWLQRNTRDDSQDGAKKEVVREGKKKEKKGKEEEEENEGLYEAGGGGWTIGSVFWPEELFEGEDHWGGW